MSGHDPKLAAFLGTPPDFPFPPPPDARLTLESLIARIEAAGFQWMVKSVRNKCPAAPVQAHIVGKGGRIRLGADCLSALTAAAKEAGIL